MKRFSLSRKNYLLAIPLCLIALLFFAGLHSVNAAAPKAGLFSVKGSLIKQLPNIPAGASVESADLYQNGSNVIIVGSPEGSKPSFSLLDHKGKVIKKFAIGGVKNKPKVNVEVGNVQGDEQKEIIISFGRGYKPEIRVYSVAGKRLASFLAFGSGGNKGGLSVALADLSGTGVMNILAASADGNASTIHEFTGYGKKIGWIDAYSYGLKKGMAIHAEDMDGDGIDEIISATQEAPSHIKTFTADGMEISGFRTAFATQSIHSSKKYHEVVVASLAKGKSKIVSYTTEGKSGRINFTPFASATAASFSIASASAGEPTDPDIIVAPGASVKTAPQPIQGRLIVIDISEQRMRRYINGNLIAEHRVSTGKWSMPTPIGKFAIRNKINVAYSRAYHLYMDNWMAFTPDGKYGIHSLPYWKLKNGGVYYEGVNHLGVRVSHGCVRLSPKESRVVFDWASVGVPVVVQN